VVDPVVSEELEIPAGKVKLWARLEHSGSGHPIVLLSCGRSGVYRDDLDLLAVDLVRAGLAVLTVDLISSSESQRAADVSQAALHRRIDAVLRWIERTRPDEGPVGLLGTGSTSAWAMWAAGARPEAIRAVVAVGGRPDEGHAMVREITAPVLMLIESPEHGTLDGVRQMQNRLHCVNELRVLPARPDRPWSNRARELSRLWFVQHMADPAADETAAPRVR